MELETYCSGRRGFILVDAEILQMGRAGLGRLFQGRATSHFVQCRMARQLFMFSRSSTYSRLRGEDRCSPLAAVRVRVKMGFFYI